MHVGSGMMGPPVRVLERPVSVLTRRDLLGWLPLLPAVALGCRAGAARDRIGRERLCIHVYDARRPLPPPLLERSPRPGPSAVGGDRFGIGLPELLLCSTAAKLLDAFPYVWPVSREDFQQLKRTIAIEFQKPFLASTADVEELRAVLRGRTASLRRTAVVFTLHDLTRSFAPDVSAACQGGAVDDLVVLKDPTLGPYLCDHPSQQKGFKRPPP